jgi:hypothetical protein
MAAPALTPSVFPPPVGLNRVRERFVFARYELDV